MSHKNVFSCFVLNVNVLVKFLGGKREQTMNDHVKGFLSVGVRLSVYCSVLGLAAAAAGTAMRAASGRPALSCDVVQSAAVGVLWPPEAGLIRLETGERVLLSGIEVPRAAGKSDLDPSTQEVQRALADLLKGQKVKLAAVSPPSKRGFIRAQVFTSGGLWVQGELVSKGLARVRTFPDQRDCAAALLAKETQARQAKRGLWSALAFTPRTPENASASVGSFQLVEGRVVETANVRGRVFLNFGPDYKTDFTLHIGPEPAKLFAQSGIKLETLDGKRVRARGWVRERNGPVIDLTAPEQLEILGE
jgi:endonuclease YncB( thermonuclease family)